MTILLPRANQPVMPWANGGGSTRQVAIEPADGSLQRGFDWRVSCAHLGSDGPFSSLPGVDRSLWLLAGRGVRLVLDGRELVLAERLQRVDFAGEATVTSHLLDGPCEDLNVMTNRARVAAAADVVALTPGAVLPLPAAPTWLVLVLDGACSLASGDVVLATGDALRGEHGDGAPPELRGRTAGHALVVGFHPRAGGRP